IIFVTVLNSVLVYAGYNIYKNYTYDDQVVSTQLPEPKVGESTAHLAAEQATQQQESAVTTPATQNSTTATGQLTLGNAVELFQDKLGVKLIVIRSESDLQNYGLAYGDAISASASDDATVLAIISLLYSEWGKYPSGFLSKVGLKKVAIVGKIMNGSYEVAAMPRAEDQDVVYYSSLFGADTYMKRVAHHELDHLIEYNAHGTYYYNDASYKACNSPTFQYSSSGIDAYTGEGINSYSLHPYEGLIDGYSTYGIEEDKAQIYTELFANIGFLNGLTDTDSYLACKKNVYLAFLQSFNPSITEEYLKQLPAVPVLLY
ncbi:MAG: hypothetical protein AAB624_03525, partial [Patescibacteria group bacterium]